MKTDFFKATILVLVTIFTISCSNDDNSSPVVAGDGSSAITPTTTPIPTDTWVKVTAKNLAGTIKQNYVIMMFDQPYTSGAALPPIKKQVTTDSNGLAYFDLNTMITSTTPTTYYFEAFLSNGAGVYTSKSISHYYVSISKGTMSTSSIIVE